MLFHTLGAQAWHWTRPQAWPAGALLLAWAAYGMLTFMPAPGAGAACQEAPDRIEAGDIVGISLRLAVSGAGGPARARYRDVRLVVQTDRGAEPTTLRPLRGFDAADGTTYRFAFKVAPDVTSISYRFRFVFDNQPKEIPGIQTIVVKSRSCRCGNQDYNKARPPRTP